MLRPTLAVFEGDGTDGYSAFAPDFPGTGGLGVTLDEARQSLMEGIGYLLEESSDPSRFLSTPTGSVDFTEFDPDHKGHYVIEWIKVEIPTSAHASAA